MLNDNQSWNSAMRKMKTDSRDIRLHTVILTYLVKCNVNKRSGIKGKPNLFTMITKLIEVFKIMLWSKYHMLPKIMSHFFKGF